MELLIHVCEKFAIHPLNVFKLAHKYNDGIVQESILEEFYLSCSVVKDEQVYVITVPEFVSIYCWDLLAGRTSLTVDLEEKENVCLEESRNVSKTLTLM